MGVDAQFLLRMPRVLEDSELRMLTARLRDISSTDLKVLPVTCYQQDGPDILPEPDEYFYQIDHYWRYYGENYERGPLPDILCFCDLIEYLQPTCKIWYGGDSSGICAAPFDKPAREKLFAYWLEHGEIPYRSYRTPSYLESLQRDDDEG